MSGPEDKDPAGLNAISPPGRSITFRGADLRIKPLTVGQLPPFARAIKPFLPAISTLFSEQEKSASLILDMIADHGEDVIQAISIATRVPADQISDAGADDLMVLVAEVITVNRDFFSRLLSQARQMAANREAPGTGLTPSSP